MQEWPRWPWGEWVRLRGRDLPREPREGNGLVVTMHSGSGCASAIPQQPSTSWSLVAFCHVLRPMSSPYSLRCSLLLFQRCPILLNIPLRFRSLNLSLLCEDFYSGRLFLLLTFNHHLLDPSTPSASTPLVLIGVGRTGGASASFGVANGRSDILQSDGPIAKQTIQEVILDVSQ